MAGFENHLLAIERKVVAVFGDRHGGKQAGSRDAALLQARGQRRDDRRRLLVLNEHILVTHQKTAKKTPRLEVQSLAGFLANPAPFFRFGHHLRRIDHNLFHRQVLGNAFAPWRFDFCFGGNDGFREQGGIRLRRLHLGKNGKQIQLIGVECLARTPEHFLHQPIDLFIQELHLLTKTLVFGKQVRIFLSEPFVLLRQVIFADFLHS